MASSYDRSGGNNDWNQYQSPTGHLSDSYNNEDVIVTELTGPGVLTRFWMPHAAANEGFPVKVYIDGQLKIDTN